MRAYELCEGKVDHPRARREAPPRWDKNFAAKIKMVPPKVGASPKDARYPRACGRNTAPGIKNPGASRPLIRTGSRSHYQLPKVFWWPEKVMVGFGELETSI
jgi:hypothetical protein